MQRDLSRLRNIGMMFSVDATSASRRDHILELTSSQRTIDRERPASESYASNDLMPAKVAMWRPGSGPFADEPTLISIFEGAARAVDGAVLVLDGARGTAEAGETAFRAMQARRVPCLAFIDDVGSIQDFEEMVESLTVELGVVAIPVYLPWNDEQGPQIVDVLRQRLVVEQDGRRELCPLPAAAIEGTSRLRRRIIDAFAAFDPTILGASRGCLDVGGDELAHVLRRATCARDSRVLIVACGSLRARRGVGPLLDAVVTYLPSPAERPPAFGLDPRRNVLVARFARATDSFAAMVFAITDDARLGRLTWLRVYSGTLQPRAPLVVLPRDERGAVERLFVPEVGGLVETEEVGPGAVVCASGLPNAQPGDTLASGRAPVVLDERGLMQPVPSPRAASHDVMRVRASSIASTSSAAASPAAQVRPRRAQR
jgi:elongation factor G